MVSELVFFPVHLFKNPVKYVIVCLRNILVLPLFKSPAYKYKVATKDTI